MDFPSFSQQIRVFFEVNNIFMFLVHVVLNLIQHICCRWYRKSVIIFVNIILKVLCQNFVKPKQLYERISELGERSVQCP